MYESPSQVTVGRSVDARVCQAQHKWRKIKARTIGIQRAQAARLTESMTAQSATTRFNTLNRHNAAQTLETGRRCVRVFKQAEIALSHGALILIIEFDHLPTSYTLRRLRGPPMT
jgi:hypothetical protein